jgi:hypothetical protein
MVNKIKIHLEKKFITKPLDRETLIKVVSSEHPSVLHRLYLIANELKEIQYFMELEHDSLACVAKVHSTFAYHGKARSQAAVVSYMKDKLKESPKYKIIFRIYEKISQKVIFEFSHITTNNIDLINTINKLELKAKDICQNKVDTY